MSSKSDPSSSTTDREIVLSRLLDAPRELVFTVWTDPKHVVHWWGPTGFTNTLIEMDVRPGGVWRHVMHGPDGTDYPNRTVYRDVVKPERLVYELGSDGPNGRPVCQVTVTFEDVDGKTLLTMRSVFPTKEARDEVVERVGAIEGGKQTLGRLADYVSKMSK